MDANGILLAFDIFPENRNEQTPPKPLESKIFQYFNCSKFIYCFDSGLGSAANRRFNSIGNRAYIITYSLKKMKKEDRENVLNPTQFRKVGSQKFIDLRTLDETLIVTYSPKYNTYQRKMHIHQTRCTEKIIVSPDRKRKGKSQNDPMRFVKKNSSYTRR